MNALVPQPTVPEERWDALRANAKAWADDKLITPEQRRVIDAVSPSPWKRSGLILKIVFFVLTLLGVVALFAFFAMGGAPKGVLTAVIAIAVAEALIRRGKAFGTGVESALWIGGLFAFIFGLPSEGKPEALLVFAAAAIIAGVRMREEMFGALAAILTVAYVAVKTHQAWPPALVAVAIALAAAAALLREWRRPSNELLFAALAVVMPLVGYIAAVLEMPYAYDAKYQRVYTPDTRLAIIFAVVALLFCTAALARRDRALLIASAVSIGITGYELRNVFGWPVEAQLMIAGALLMTIAWILAIALRRKRRGFVITPTSLTRYDEAMQIGATVAAAPSSATAPAAPTRESGGGTFGGAGASGDY